MSDRYMFVVGREGLSGAADAADLQDRARSGPVFVQFLEAAWRLLEQNRRAFEFNECFLVSLHDACVSSRFGTFLCNSEKERKEFRLREKTLSAWPFLLMQRDGFVNPFFRADGGPDGDGGSSDRGRLRIEDGPAHCKLWSGMFCRYEMEKRTLREMQGASRTRPWSRMEAAEAVCVCLCVCVRARGACLRAVYCWHAGVREPVGRTLELTPADRVRRRFQPFRVSERDYTAAERGGGGRAPACCDSGQRDLPRCHEAADRRPARFPEPRCARCR